MQIQWLPSQARLTPLETLDLIKSKWGATASDSFRATTRLAQPSLPLLFGRAEPGQNNRIQVLEDFQQCNSSNYSNTSRNDIFGYLDENILSATECAYVDKKVKDIWTLLSEETYRNAIFADPQPRQMQHLLAECPSLR
jgi:hypothetical protein